MSPISSETRVAHCDLGPISSKRTIAHNVFLKFYLSRKSTLAQCDLGQFPATGKFCLSVFHLFWLPNNTGHFEAKRPLRSLTSGQF